MTIIYNKWTINTKGHCQVHNVLGGTTEVLNKEFHTKTSRHSK